MSKYIKIWECVECKKEVTWAVKMNSYGVCPACGFTVEGTVMATSCRSIRKQPGRIRIAWNCFKLKVVRKLLGPILKWHIKRELKRRGQ